MNASMDFMIRLFLYLILSFISLLSYHCGIVVDDVRLGTFLCCAPQSFYCSFLDAAHSAAFPLSFTAVTLFF